MSKSFPVPAQASSLQVVAAVLFQLVVTTNSNSALPMFIHMPLLRMLCVPYHSPTAKGCHMIELINLLAIPEENRVVFLFTRKYQNDNPPPLRYEPGDDWQCGFKNGLSTPIRYVYPHTQGHECCHYNHLSLAQCDLPSSARTLLLNGKVIIVTATVVAVDDAGDNVKSRFKYSLRTQRWKRKKLLGMCVR